MDDFDFFESDGHFGELDFEEEAPRKTRKGQARQRYEQLMEEKRLKQELDDIGYW